MMASIQPFLQGGRFLACQFRPPGMTFLASRGGYRQEAGSWQPGVGARSSFLSNVFKFCSSAWLMHGESWKCNLHHA